MLSKHTAFVAVEERTEATEGTMQSRNVMTQIQRAGVGKSEIYTPFFFYVNLIFPYFNHYFFCRGH